MTVFALVSGTLFRAPEQRVSKAGKTYVQATIKTRDGDASAFWRVLIFSETQQAEMQLLAVGDAVSVQGAMKVELYKPENGEARISLSIIADSLLGLRPPSRRRAPAEGRPHREPRRAAHCERQPRLVEMKVHAGSDNTDHFGDDMPF